MLYRPPRTTLRAVLRNTAAFVAGAIADWARTGADTAHFDGLSDHQLRDLGVRRFNDRAETWYR